MKDPRRADVYKVIEAPRLPGPEDVRRHTVWYAPRQEPKPYVTKTIVIPPSKS